MSKKNSDPSSELYNEMQECCEWGEVRAMHKAGLTPELLKWMHNKLHMKNHHVRNLYRQFGQSGLQAAVLMMHPDGPPPVEPEVVEEKPAQAAAVPERKKVKKNED